MKKILAVAIFFLTTLFICGCNKYDHPIAGKTYESYLSSPLLSSSMYNSVSFFKSGKCEWKMRDKNGTTIENHLKWEVNGNNINILYDNSTTWKPSARGKIWRSGRYNSSDDTITFGEEVYTLAY